MTKAQVAYHLISMYQYINHRVLTYGQTQPSNKSMVLLESVMVVAREIGEHQDVDEYKRQASTYLRTQGKALRTEMMTKQLVMIPLASTESCCVARYLMICAI